MALLNLASQMGLHVWADKNDRNKQYKGHFKI